MSIALFLSILRTRKENQNTPIISNQESLLNPSKQATTYNTTYLFFVCVSM